MSEKIFLTEPVYEGLLRHLVEIDEARSGKRHDCFPHHLIENVELSWFLGGYVSAVENALAKVSISDKAANHFPIITIGSQIEIKDLDTGEVFKYRIVTPFQHELAEDHISCLSPLGRALLLKSVGDVIKVKVPIGQVQYEILSISL